MHGLGNDFILFIDSDISKSYADLARSLCDRHYGIGADGLLVISPQINSHQKLRIFNADGSEAETCGNGLRCAAKFLRDNGYVSIDLFSINTPFASHDVKCHLENGKVALVTVNMGAPKDTALERIALTAEASGKGGKTFSGYSISLGNPHFVIFQDKISSFEKSWYDYWGKLLSTHEAFSFGCNIEFAEITDTNKLRLVVYERGVGMTQACGSGACAAAVTAVALGNVVSPVFVELPGGEVTVEWDGKSDCFLTGTAKEVFRGELIQDERVVC